MGSGSRATRRPWAPHRAARRPAPGALELCRLGSAAIAGWPPFGILGQSWILSVAFPEHAAVASGSAPTCAPAPPLFLGIGIRGDTACRRLLSYRV